MKRRIFIAAAAGALAWPLAGRAQNPGRIPKIGVLVPGEPPRDVFDALRAGLEELGYLDGKTVRLEVRWNPEDSLDRWVPLATELVELGVSVIVGGTGASSAVVRHVTGAIPIVSPTLNNPIGSGLIRSFAQPGGSVTGIALITPELIEKRVQLVTEAMPHLRRVAILWRVDELGRFQLDAAEAATRAIGLETINVHVTTADDLPLAFERLRNERVEAMVMMQAALFRLNNHRIASLSRTARMPVISGETGFASAGGLMNYGASIPENWRRMAHYVDKILKGAKPTDLPVEQPAKYELVVNARAGRELGLELPLALLARADEVIE